MKAVICFNGWIKTLATLQHRCATQDSLGRHFEKPWSLYRPIFSNPSTLKKIYGTLSKIWKLPPGRDRQRSSGLQNCLREKKSTECERSNPTQPIKSDDWLNHNVRNLRVPVEPLLLERENILSLNALETYRKLDVCSCYSKLLFEDRESTIRSCWDIKKLVLIGKLDLQRSLFSWLYSTYYITSRFFITTNPSSAACI